MSQETLSWLSENVLVGYEEKRGKAWWYRASDEGPEPNHYVGPVPVEDVRRRLFHWKAAEADVTATITEGEKDGLAAHDPTRKAVVRPDTLEVLGVHKRGYKVHQYQDWLLDVVADLLDDDLQIGSAGLLRRGGLAWVSVEVPENVTTPEGVEFRPHLLAGTSHDGTLATNYNRCVQLVVCDNTLEVGLAEGASSGMRYRVRHTRHSQVRLSDARDALAVVYDTADDFGREVAALTATKVSDEDFQRFLDTLVPVPDDPGRAQTNAEDKHAAYGRLWRDDERVAPWRNTAFGVLQAVNTAAHHEFGVRGARPERNMLKTVYRQFAEEDRRALQVLDSVLT